MCRNHLCAGTRVPRYPAHTCLLQAAAGAGAYSCGHGLSAGGQRGSGDEGRHNLQLQSGGSGHEVGGLQEGEMKQRLWVR